MLGCQSRILDAARGERTCWINSKVVGKNGVGILLSRKYARLVTSSGSPYEYRVVWIKLEGVERRSLGIAHIYAPQHPNTITYILAPWKNPYSRIVNELLEEILIWWKDKVINQMIVIESLVILNTIVGMNFLACFKSKKLYQRGPRFSWYNGQLGVGGRLSRLNRFYVTKDLDSNFQQKAYSSMGTR